MNGTIKSVVLMGLGGTALAFGLHFQKAREIETFQKDYEDAAKRGASLTTEIEGLRAKIDLAKSDVGAADLYEKKHNESLAKVAEEQKKIDELLGKWPALDAERVAAVKTVREKESLLPPRNIALADGTKLENLVVRNVPDEKTVSVEHSNGLVKIAAEKLPEDLKAKLGLGWAPQIPARLSFDRNGNPVVSASSEAEPIGDPSSPNLNIPELDSTTIAGVTRALAAVEDQLKKVQYSFDEERAKIRSLSQFHQDMIKAGTRQTYAQLKKEANARLVGLAGKLQALKAEQNKLKAKMKTF